MPSNLCNEPVQGEFPAEPNQIWPLSIDGSGGPFGHAVVVLRSFGFFGVGSFASAIHSLHGALRPGSL